jgi:hypothetical protein
MNALAENYHTSFMPALRTGQTIVAPTPIEAQANQWNAEFAYGDRLATLLGVSVEVCESSARTIVFTIPADSTCIPILAGIQFNGASSGKIWLSMTVEQLDRHEARAEYVNARSQQ